MIFGSLMMLIAITISAIAAWYSIAGLTAIFSAAVIPVMIMGGALEAGKIAATVWLHNNWERAGWKFKTYLVPAIILLMLLTSMGIFGFLSKAHSDQGLVSGDAMSKVAIFDEKIATEKDNIAQAKKALEQMNAQVDQMLGRTDSDKGAERAVQIRKNQAKERAALQADIAKSQKTIAALQAERAPLAAEFRKVESEVGPIKYIAALLYGDNPDQNILERAVRWVIILIVVVFDPLALTLILASNKQFEWAREGKGGWVHSEEEKTVTTVAAAEEPMAEPPPPEVIPEPEPQPDPIPCLKCGTEMVDEFPIGLICPNPTCGVPEPVPEEEVAVVEPEPTLSDTEIDQLVENDVEEEILIDEPVVAEEPVVEEVVAKVEPIITPIDEDLLDASATVIENLQGEVEAKNLTIKEKERQLQEMQAKVDEVIAQRNVEQQRATNLSAQLMELLHNPGMTVDIPDLTPVADNAPKLKSAPTAGFGLEFPQAPSKGDLFLRTDYLPSLLFKYNGSEWIELDKTSTDTLAYNDSYIEFLIEKLRTGEYDRDDISDVEHEQIAQYLQGKNGKS